MPIPIHIKINNACPKHIFKGLYNTIRLGIKTVLNFTIVPNTFLNDLKNLDANFAP